MSILYSKEHFSCYNYEKGKNASLEILKVEKGGLIERDLFTSEIVFVIKGNFILNYGKVIDLEVTNGKVMFFPPGSHVHADVKEDTLIIVCRIRGVISLCECVSLEHVFLYPENELNVKNDFHMLNINDKLEKFIDFVIECAGDGLKCSYYFETKMKELFFLLRAYYPKEELRAFFSPLLSHNSKFMNLMYQNYRNAKNIKDLAEVSLYSESGFKKQFQKVFGTSASDWLRNQKASLIFHDLNCSEMSIKELTDKYDFSSVSSFTTFCQNMFEKTPGQIRSKK
jgi:AraC-type DNA-binding domain-containing proteins